MVSKSNGGFEPTTVSSDVHTFNHYKCMLLNANIFLEITYDKFFYENDDYVPLSYS